MLETYKLYTVEFYITTYRAMATSNRHEYVYDQNKHIARIICCPSSSTISIPNLPLAASQTQTLVDIGNSAELKFVFNDPISTNPYCTDMTTR